jgi:hypothetical protein
MAAHPVRDDIETERVIDDERVFVDGTPAPYVRVPVAPSYEWQAGPL